MIQIYTGNGKGKTTAAVGLAVRAQASSKVLFAQFLKDGSSSEIQSLKKLPNVDVEIFGNGNWIKGDLNKEQKELAERGLDLLSQKRSSYDVVIADEIITAVSLAVLSEERVIKFARENPKEKELVLTGRGATKKMIDIADLVTEMKEIKHYYNKGLKARKGIEW